MRKYLSSLVFSCLLVVTAHSQSVGIGTTTPNSNAALEIKSNNKGFLMPRISQTARLGMGNPGKGMMVYDSTLANFYYHDGNTWRLFSEKNEDSLLVDYGDAPQETTNIVSNGTTTALSGILYDDGGPSGNYTNSKNMEYYVYDHSDAILYEVKVEQLSMESPNDYLEIYVYGGSGNDKMVKLTGSGSTTTTYRFAATGLLVFHFVSNATNNQAGFKIRWSQLLGSDANNGKIPDYGWYFNTKKLAARGGMNVNGAWTTDSLGKLSLAYGLNTFAKGENSIALGYDNRALGINSTAIGQSNEVDAAAAVAIGLRNKVTGSGAVALGWLGTSSGTSSSAFGYQTRATADYSTAMGYYALASGENAASIGYNTVASGRSSTAFGEYSYALADNTTAIGYRARVVGEYAAAIGTGVYSKAYSSITIGQYNDSITTSSSTSWKAADPLFIIGNGTATSDRSNALTMLKNGNTGFGTTAPKAKLHIDGGTDAGLADNSGFLIIGDVSGSNLVFDNNEIVARNNGANNTLYLQYEGGDLEVGGKASKPGGGSWSAASDGRLKQNVQAYKDGLQMLLKINPVSFQYNQLSGYNTNKQFVGVVAQDLQKVAPYMVGSFDKNGTDYLNVDNSAMTYMLINSVKEQQKQMEAQQKEIAELKALVKELLKSKR